MPRSYSPTPWLRRKAHQPALSVSESCESKAGPTHPVISLCTAPSIDQVFRSCFMTCLWIRQLLMPKQFWKYEGYRDFYGNQGDNHAKDIKEVPGKTDHHATPWELVVLLLTMHSGSWRPSAPGQPGASGGRHYGRDSQTYNFKM